MQQIKLHYITQDQINELFKRLSLADSMNKIMFNRSDEGYEFFLKRVASEILAICKPEFPTEIFQLEVQWCLNQCLLNEELTSTFGKPIFAQRDNFIKILNLIEDCVNESYD
jgi:hypothetical protein